MLFRSTVSITRVVHKSVTVLLECRVDPNRALSIGFVGVVHLIIALLVSWEKVRYVQGKSHILSVKVVRLSISKDCGGSRVVLSDEWAKPRGTL